MLLCHNLLGVQVFEVLTLTLPAHLALDSILGGWPLLMEPGIQTQGFLPLFSLSSEHGMIFSLAILYPVLLSLPSDIKTWPLSVVRVIFRPFFLIWIRYPHIISIHLFRIPPTLQRKCRALSTPCSLWAAPSSWPLSLEPLFSANICKVFLSVLHDPLCLVPALSSSSYIL